jgi:acyl-homoserine-lactone acylase
MRKIWLSAALLSGCGGAATPTTTEILWDTWGVPHIFAKDNADAFRALGWAQAAAHGNLLLKLYAEARGRSAEYWGEANLPNDRFVRTMGIPGRAEQWYRQINPEYRGYLDAFAEGINQYVDGHREQIADSVEVVLPVTAKDVLAHGQRIVNFLFMLFGQVELPETMRNDVRPGSNMWAIGPQRSASGHPLLLGNPHLGWYDLYLFFEAHQVTPDRNWYGTTLIGMPTLAIGFNDFVAWSHTVNTQDGADVYRLVKQGDGYRLDGAEKAFGSRVEVLGVRQPDGTVRRDTLVVKESVHGPVFQEDGKNALALRVAGLDDPNASEQWWRMGRARSMAEFESIVKEVHIPTFNVMAASQDGHIYYFFGGKTPKRARGDFAAWTDPVPGDSSALVWNEMLPYGELPSVMDPASGWLQNANDPPWTATWPLVFDPDSFAPYVAPRQMSFRPQRSALMQLDDSSVTFDELLEYKHSTRMALADRILPELITVAETRGDADAKRAAKVLGGWDRSADVGSRGAVLFEAFVRGYWRAAKGQVFARAWQLDSALTTPAGLADPVGAAQALAEAARETERAHGALDVAYGEVNRLRYGGKDFPANGAPGDPFGVFRVAYFDEGEDGKGEIMAGDTYYQVVELSNPVRAKVLLAYGNATQPGSRHVGDQLELFSKKQMRDAWRTRMEIEANLERREAIR